MSTLMPTQNLRLKMEEEWPNDETRRCVFALQQLWVTSSLNGAPSEWRDVPMVDENDNPVSHITAARLFGRPL